MGGRVGAAALPHINIYMFSRRALSRGSLVKLSVVCWCRERKIESETAKEQGSPVYMDKYRVKESGWVDLESHTLCFLSTFILLFPSTKP